MCFFGKNSLIYRSLSEIQKYLNRRNNSVKLILMEEMKSFREVFLYQLHTRIQKYLRSCMRGRIFKINVGILYFSDIIRNIDTSTCQANTHHVSETSSSQRVKISIHTGEEMKTTNQAHVNQPSRTRTQHHQDTEEIFKKVVET